MKFKDVINEADKMSEIWRDFYKSSGKLGMQIKNMPVNSKTEGILSKLNKFAREEGYLSEPVADKLLTSSEKSYIKKYSE